MDDNTRLIDLTVGEIKKLFEELGRPAPAEDSKRVSVDLTDDKYDVVGIRGITQLLKVGTTKANEIVKDERYKEAIIHPYNSSRIYADGELLKKLYFQRQ